MRLAMWLHSSALPQMWAFNRLSLSMIRRDFWSRRWNVVPGEGGTGETHAGDLSCRPQPNSVYHPTRKLLPQDALPSAGLRFREALYDPICGLAPAGQAARASAAGRAHVPAPALWRRLLGLAAVFAASGAVHELAHWYLTRRFSGGLWMCLMEVGWAALATCNLSWAGPCVRGSAA